jgi:hypothetical protein
MKNILFLFISGLFILSSCKKEHKAPVDPVGKKYRIVFNLKNPELFTNSANKLKVNTATAANINILKYLNYLVYDSNGFLVHRISQDTTTKSFGVFTDELVPANYTMVFVGGMLGIKYTGDTDHLTLSNSYLVQPSLHDDFFYKKINVNLSNAGVSQEISLDRIAAKLQIVIQDAIPADVTGIKVDYRDYYNFSFYSDSLLNYSATGVEQFSANLKATDIGKVNYSFSNLIYNTYTPFTVVITVMSNTMQRTPITITNVICKRNQITVLSGKAFSNAIPQYNSGFQLTINPDWGSSTTTSF